MTLVETLISSVLFSIVIAGVYMVYTTMQGTMVRGEMRSDLQQNARIGLGRMVSEIRMMGLDMSNVLPLATPYPRAALRAATATCISFIVSDELGATKQVTYDVDGTTLRRREDPWNASRSTFEGGGGAQPIADAVQALTFTYYDTYDKVIAPGSWLSTHRCPPSKDVTQQTTLTQLNFWQMRAVRRIAITIRTAETRAGTYMENFTLTTDVRPRNL